MSLKTATLTLSFRSKLFRDLSIDSGISSTKSLWKRIDDESFSLSIIISVSSPSRQRGILSMTHIMRELYKSCECLKWLEKKIIFKMAFEIFLLSENQWKIRRFFFSSFFPHWTWLFLGGPKYDEGMTITVPMGIKCFIIQPTWSILTAKPFVFKVC